MTFQQYAQILKVEKAKMIDFADESYMITSASTQFLTTAINS
ncbi:MAG: hypothetical protein ACJASL_004404 [Paraglaciecola sp.]|jgi:hypothetical protein